MSTLSSLPPSLRISVGLADIKVSKNPAVLLCSLPLGACLGIILYEPRLKMGGLLHSLLPSSKTDPIRAAKCPAMFIDSGLDAMLKKLMELGAAKENLHTYVVGGAQILDDATVFNIGRKNYEFFVNLVNNTGLSIHGEDVGGNVNRSVSIELGSGEVFIKQTGQNTVKTLCKR